MGQDKPKKSPPGRPPRQLKIEREWGEAVEKAIRKDKPKEGWPEPDPKEKDRG